MDVINLKRYTEDGLIEEDTKAERLISPIAYDEETGVFLNNDNTLGFAFLCYGLTGGNESHKEKLEQLMKQAYPNGSIMQFSMFKSPDIEPILARYELLRNSDTTPPVLKGFIEERAKFLREHTLSPIVMRGKMGGHYDVGQISDTKILICFKMPMSRNVSETDASSVKAAKNLMKFATKFYRDLFSKEGSGEDESQAVVSDEDLAICKSWQDRIQSLLATCDLGPRLLDAAEYIRIMETMLNWSKDASWRTRYQGEYDEGLPINAQIFDPITDVVKADKQGLQLGDDCYVRVLSAKKFPPAVFFGEALSFVGDMMAGIENIRCNYLLTVNVYFPDPVKAKDGLLRKHQFLTNQAVGPLVRFVPVIADKKASMDIIYDDLQQGARPVQLSHTVVLFARSPKELEDQSARLRSIWATFHYTMMEDRFVMLPMFKNALPMCAEAGAVRELHRYKTMTSTQAPVCLPVFAEWKGSATPYLLLQSRNGQCTTFSVYDSTTNYNFLVAATAGAGKSFFMNELLVSYMSTGSPVWVIDAGKSYEKLCKIVGGDFLQFGEGSNVCLNPFPLVQDWADDQDMLTALVTTMASEKGDLSDLQVSSLKRIMDELWTQKGGKMLIDDIANRCLADNDSRVNDIGKQLYSFTSKGSYGRYFNGPNTVSFKKQLTVLELDELQGQKHLRQVVLLQLIYRIQSEVFLGERSLHKILAIDEAWDLLGNGEGASATFIEHAYRKFRKYNGSIGIITQSLNDLTNNPVGRVVMENGQAKILLRQQPESIEMVKKDNGQVLPEYGFNLLKSLRTETGVFSEILIKCDGGMGVTRLVVTPFEQLAFSTHPDDVQALNDLQAKGLSVTEAIYELMRQRGYAVPPHQEKSESNQTEDVSA